MDDDFTPPPLNLVPLPWAENKRREDGTFEEGASGKPPRFVTEPEIRTKMIQFVQLGAPRIQAAAAVGVPHRTFAGWRARAKDGDEPYVTFFDEIDQAEAFAEMRLMALWSNAAPTSWQAAAKFLSVRFRSRWSEDAPPIADAGDLDLLAPIEDVEHLSEIMAAYEEAGIVPEGHVVEAEG